MNQAIVFGSHDHLVGVWNAPTQQPSPPRDVAVVMVTPGMLPSSGPFRLHIDLAKRLAESSIASFRFDLSGIGESLAIGTAGRSIDRAAGEISGAIDWLAETQGIQKVLLFGLCSGADDSIQAALSDDRIAGVVAMDGCGYQVPGFRLHRWRSHYLPRMMRPRKWISLGTKFFKAKQAVPSSLSPGTDVREFPDRDQAAAELLTLARRHTQVHFVYTGGVSEYYNHAGQFRTMFPELHGRSEITHQFFPEFDHVAFRVEDRDRLVRHIGGQIDSMIQSR